ncbi:transposase [Sphingomonas sp. 179-I 2A4 NHS]|jgi:hypothetical protein|uniref:transposase n=1 Tax=unclassified Sphingomonas TaxID=196159 RepID=UPI000C4F1879|nr:transposase [Sphingomonas sp.]
MTAIDVRVGRCAFVADIADRPPLGWRFWSLAGFAGDPLDPDPYAGSRCLALAMVDVDGSDRWLCAMELDHSFQLLCTHDLFPSADQAGAERFAREVLDAHARQPRLL